MTVKLQIHNATFTVDGQPDTVVQVMPEPNGSVSYTIKFGGDATTHGHVPATNVLQSAEALQFVADTLGSMVPGRLSPFVRGWISTAADANHIAIKVGFWNDKPTDLEIISVMQNRLAEIRGLLKDNPLDEAFEGFTRIESELAKMVIRLMDLAHVRGWRIPQAVETIMKRHSEA